MKTGTNILFTKRSGKRKCKGCKDYFTPDPRNRYHQNYCTKPSCRKESKRASQQRWLSSKKGSGYFSGTYNVERVQRWRKEHPGYWKKAIPREEVPLQEVLTSQLVEYQNVKKEEFSQPPALQDISFLQPALFIGLIASLTGSTLQDDIAKTTRRFINSGQDILSNAALPII